MIAETCYWCGATATSHEHVPPKCLYPEAKDVGTALTGNRITVPSCDVHNSKKSMDDEYLMCVLAVNLQNNELGLNQAATKVRRALVRSERFRKAVLREFQHVVVVDNSTGEMHRTGAFKVDTNRVNNVLEHMARALYFYHYGRTWDGEVECNPEFLINMNGPDQAERNSQLEEFRQASGVVFAAAEKRGEIPEVFYFQVHASPRGIAFRLTFCEGTRATIVLPTKLVQM